MFGHVNKLTTTTTTTTTTTLRAYELVWPVNAYFKRKDPSQESGGYSTKFYMGRLRSEVRPFSRLYTILTEKARFRLPFIKESTPFTYLLRNIASLKQSPCYFHVVLN